MFYAFSYTVDGTETETSPHEEGLHLTAGVIHQVDVLFQDGCNHEVYVQIFDDNLQLWPTNRGEKLRGNATVISFREFYELSPSNQKLTLKVWTDLSSDFKEIIVQIGVLPKHIIQPLSFDELFAAATGLE